MVLHKNIRKNRIQPAYSDGKITIVEKIQKTDKYNTPIPGESDINELGSYFFRLKGIHSQDKIEFGNQGLELERQVLIPLNMHIHSGMTAVLNDDDNVLYDIVKIFPDFNNRETEILLAKEGGYYNS